MIMKVLSVIGRRMILLLMATAVAGCIVTPDVDHTAIPTASVEQIDGAIIERERLLIKAEITSYYRDLSARDWDAFAAHFWRGATVSSVWEPDDEGRRVVFSTVPEFIVESDPGPDVLFDEQLGTAQVHVSGNLAIVWAQYRVRFGDQPGNVREWSGIDAFTLIKHVGVWKITSMAFAPE
jgi:ketosteroid isomerase-like protein